MFSSHRSVIAFAVLALCAVAAQAQGPSTAPPGYVSPFSESTTVPSQPVAPPISALPAVGQTVPGSPVIGSPVIGEVGTLFAPSGRPEFLGLDTWDPFVTKNNARRDRWMSLDMSVRTGPIFGLGGGVFEDRINGGWTAEYTVRAPWRPWDRPFVFFTELGAAYAGNEGDKLPISTSGTFIDNSPGAQTRVSLDDFYETQLLDMQRGSVHAAVGWYVMPFVNRSTRCTKLRLLGRVGMRVGHLSTHINQTPSADLEAVIANQMANPLSNPLFYQFKSDVRRTDEFWGVLGSIGAGWTWNDIWLGVWRFEQLTFSFECQVAHDWFRLGTLGGSDNGMLSIAPMLNTTFAF